MQTLRSNKVTSEEEYLLKLQQKNLQEYAALPHSRKEKNQ